MKKSIFKELGVSSKSPCDAMDAFRDAMSNDVKILEKLIDGNDDFESLVIRSMFTKKERRDMIPIYTKIQSILWKSLAVGKSSDDCDKFISDTWNDWTKVHVKVVEIINKISDGWKKVEIKRGNAYYLY